MREMDLLWFGRPRMVHPGCNSPRPVTVIATQVYQRYHHAYLIALVKLHNVFHNAFRNTICLTYHLRICIESVATNYYLRTGEMLVVLFACTTPTCLLGRIKELLITLFGVFGAGFLYRADISSMSRHCGLKVNDSDLHSCLLGLIFSSAEYGFWQRSSLLGSPEQSIRLKHIGL